MARAVDSAADRVLLDLEDAVEPASKGRARHAVVDLLKSLPADRRRRISVRVNAVGEGLSYLDLVAIAESQALPASFVIPKVRGEGDVWYVVRLLEDVIGPSGDDSEQIRVEVLIETATGLADLRSWTAAVSRLSALVLGYADLAASLGRPGSGGPMTWLPAQHELLVAARAAGIQAVDGPYLGVRTDAHFAESVQNAYALGFDGKWVIHPCQIDLVNDVFSPSADAVSWAAGVLDALDRATAEGGGATTYDGQMIDEAVAITARGVLARAKSLTGADGS